MYDLLKVELILDADVMGTELLYVFPKHETLAKPMEMLLALYNDSPIGNTIIMAVEDQVAETCGSSEMIYFKVDDHIHTMYANDGQWRIGGFYDTPNVQQRIEALVRYLHMIK